MTMLRMCLALLLLAALPAQAQGITERSTNVNGVRINYKIAGQGPVSCCCTATPRPATCGGR